MPSFVYFYEASSGPLDSPLAAVYLSPCQSCASWKELWQTTLTSHQWTNSCSGQLLPWPSLASYVRVSSPHHPQPILIHRYTWPALTSVLPRTDPYYCNWKHPKQIPSGWAAPLHSLRLAVRSVQSGQCTVTWPTSFQAIPLLFISSQQGTFSPGTKSPRSCAPNSNA